MKKCKKLTAVFLAVIMLLSVVPIAGIDFFKASALETGQLSDTVYYTFDESAGTLTISGTGDMPEYFYFEELSDYKIKNIVFEDGITSIGQCELYYPTVESVIIGSGAVYIYPYAFGCYDNLASMVVDENNPVFDSRDNCNAIIETVANKLVAGCQNTVIPYGIEIIGENAFSCCRNMTGLTLPSTLTAIEDHAFEFCENLSEITIPDSVTSIGIGAFGGCSSLEEITIPYGVTSIEADTFTFCMNLRSIIIPDTVTSISEHAFYYCVSLDNISIPFSITYISDGAFSNCDALTDVYYGADYEQWNNTIIYDNNESLLNAKIHFFGIDDDRIYLDNNIYYFFDEATGTLTISGEGYLECYESPFRGDFSIERVIFEEGITYIGDFLLENCENLKSVAIPLSVTEIEYNAFYECHLTDVYYNGTFEQWKEIYGSENDELYYVTNGIHLNDGKILMTPTVYYTLDEATGTMTVGGEGDMPDYEYYFDYSFLPFDDIDSIKNVIIEDGITSINGFNDCDSLETVTIGSGVEKIGEAFYRSSYDSELSLDIFYNGNFEQWNKIEKNEYFFDYYVPKTVYLNDGKTVIADNVYYTFDEATSTMIFGGEGTIPNCAYYDDYAASPFNENSSIKNLIIGDGITEISECLFMNCDSLKSATISGSVSRIGYNVFCECDRLTDIYYVGTEEEWNAVEKDDFEICCPDVAVHFITVADEPIAENSALELNSADGGEITISGFTAGTTVDDLAKMTADGWTASVATADNSDRIGTGSVITLTSAAGETIECTAVVYGDTNGDAWYDGTDSLIVNCIANGLLSEAQVGEAAYTAADCNHDGVVDGADAALLEQAGLILANVDQSKTPAELFEDAAFCEYINLIDQSPFTAEKTVEEAPTDTAPADKPVVTKTLLQKIMDFVIYIFRMITSYIPKVF